MDHNGEKAAGIRFAAAVKNSVEKYLGDFGLRLIGERHLGVGTRDSYYELKYVGEVGLVFSYGIFECTMGVGLVQLENDNFPERYSFVEKKDWGIGIDLHRFIEYKIKKKIDNPLPNPLGPKTATVAEIKRAFEVRQKELTANLEDIVDRYVNDLSIYGEDVLRGDRSYFLPVQESYTVEVKKEYFGSI